MTGMKIPEKVAGGFSSVSVAIARRILGSNGCSRDGEEEEGGEGRMRMRRRRRRRCQC